MRASRQINFFPMQQYLLWWAKCIHFTVRAVTNNDMDSSCKSIECWTYSNGGVTFYSAASTSLRTKNENMCCKGAHVMWKYNNHFNFYILEEKIQKFPCIQSANYSKGLLRTVKPEQRTWNDIGKKQQQTVLTDQRPKIQCCFERIGLV